MNIVYFLIQIVYKKKKFILNHSFLRFFTEMELLS